LNGRLKFSVQLRVVFASDVEEQLFFAAKIFALEEVTITL
jgi:hypothetical protein